VGRGVPAVPEAVSIGTRAFSSAVVTYALVPFQFRPTSKADLPTVTCLPWAPVTVSTVVTVSPLLGLTHRVRPSGERARP